MKKFKKGAQLYGDSYFERLKDRQKLYSVSSLKYSDAELMEINKELKEYYESGVTKRTNEELWAMYYAVKCNIHPETGKPVTKIFRWSTFVPVNVPIMIGVSCITPSPFNQIFFQSLSQTYNFGRNLVNSTTVNQRTNYELITSWSAAVFAAIVSSAGLREVFNRMKKKGKLVTAIMPWTPLCGIFVANTVTLYFSRSKELKYGIPVHHPATDMPIEEMPSRKAAFNAFMESWAIRMLLPIPMFVVPMISSRFAKKHFKFYSRTIPKLAFDASVAAASLSTGLIFIMAGFSTTGYVKLNKLEPRLQQRLKAYPPHTIIQYAKGL